MQIKVKMPKTYRQIPPQVEMVLQMVKAAMPSREAVSAYSKKVTMASATMSNEELTMMMLQDAMTAVAGYLPLVAGVAGQAATVLPSLQAGIEYFNNQPVETQPALRAWILSKGGLKVLPMLAIELGSTLTSADDPETATAELDKIMAQVVAAHNAASAAMTEDPRREPALRAFSAEQGEHAETTYWVNFFAFGQAIAEAINDEDELARVDARFEQLVEQYGESEEDEEEEVDLDNLFDDIFTAMLG